MAIWELHDSGLRRLDETSFDAEGIRERQNLQRLLREQIDVIAPGTLVLAEEYGEWSESRRRIDLLALDRSANLVVIELKRTKDGGHMELQAIRYAAMVSTMTFVEAVKIFRRSRDLESEDEAEAHILEFLGWEEPDEDQFANEVSIVLASAEFSKELTTSVLWLNERSFDIRCVRLKPYRFQDHVLLDVQQVLPLPEAADYQVRVLAKEQEKRRVRAGAHDTTRYDLRVGDKRYKNLPKRWLVYRAVRGAVESGASPENLAPLIHQGHLKWIHVDGSPSAEDFELAVSHIRRPTGTPYDTRRFFTGENELIRHKGRTYALSNQWGDERALNSVRKIAERYPELRIEFMEAVPSAG